MKKIFTILLTISVLGVSAQETETITSLGNYKKRNSGNTSTRKIKWIYQLSSSNLYDYGLNSSSNTSSSNPKIIDSEENNLPYPNINLYYKNAPKTFKEALKIDLNDKEYALGLMEYRYSGQNIIPVDNNTIETTTTTNLLNFGVYYPVTSWFGIKSLASIKKYKQEFGYHLAFYKDNDIRSAQIGFTQKNYTSFITVLPVLQTPYIFNKVSFYASAGLSVGYVFTGNIRELGVSEFNESTTFNFEYIDRTYKLRSDIFNLSINMGGGVSYKLNEDKIMFLEVTNSGRFFFSDKGSIHFNNFIAPFSVTDFTIGLMF